MARKGARPYSASTPALRAATAPSGELVGYWYRSTSPDRNPAPKKDGAPVGVLTDPFRLRKYVYESLSERAVLILFIALSDVVEIREQVTKKYRRHGGERSYTFDIVVRMRSGRVIAWAVKRTEEELMGDDTCEILKAIHAEHGTSFADEYRSVTYEKLDPVALKNAKFIVDCGGDQDVAAQARVRDVLADLPAMVTPRQIGEATKLGCRGARAAIALIQSGILGVPPGRELNADRPLENRGRVSATANHAP